jgi:hypothetical protein
MNEYRIEKLRCPVTVVLAGGERIAGDLFVSATVPYRQGPEDAADVFNAPDPFVPLAQESGEIVILAKARVAEVETGAPSEQEELRFAGLRPSAIEVRLAGLPPRSGFMHLAVRHERPRLLDYLNALTEQFLVLYSTDGVRLLNRALIERVRPLD